MKILVATRNGHKLIEIRRILSELGGVEFVSPEAEGLEYEPEEDSIEDFDTFEENAVAKARWFHERSGLPALADDSGLAVDALGGAPGVRSKRFSPEGEALAGEARDRENNRFLLERLEGVELPDRTAHFVCVAALVRGDGEPLVVRGEAPGIILDRPRGREGFGYDPLFFDPGLGRTFAELTPEEKAARGHRGRAFREMGTHLARIVNGAGDE